MSQSVVPPTWISREEYLAWSSTQSVGRHERIDGKIVAMAPERGAHLRVKANAWLALRNAIRANGLDCQAVPDGATISIGDSDYEPDALVNCGEPMADDAIVAPNPIIVVEVLSPATAGRDNSTKLIDYFLLPSIQHYLIVHPIKRQVVHHRRDTAMVIQTRIVLNGSIELDPPGIALAMDDLYAP